MRDRFTKKSKHGRGHIPKFVRRNVFVRDSYRCLFCKLDFAPQELTLDHLVPISKGGLNEPSNLVTCCTKCNQLKADKPLVDFAKSVGVSVEQLPVHLDPVIDNKELSAETRNIRKQIYTKHRKGKLRLSGNNAQKKIEKIFRRNFWRTSEGLQLEKDYSTLPGHVRIMIPEIKTIAKSHREFWLLLELAKSASTRNLINSDLFMECDVEARVTEMFEKERVEKQKKKLGQAIIRFEKYCRLKRI
tara:strand:- start:234 stop:968 length:735 start_codon:yes stop_codon:yes gene_type:complete